jgi:hypothetical protein
MAAGLLAIVLSVSFDGPSHLTNDDITLLRHQESFA